MKSPEAIQGWTHLKEGVSPIIACVGSTPDHIGKSAREGALKEDFERLSKDSVTDVNFFASAEFYVISQIDSKSKSSDNYYDCVGIVAVGTDKANGENISFITHESPELSESQADNFYEDLNRTLDELRSRCEEMTVDIVIVGGATHNEDFMEKNDTAVSILKSKVEQKFGFKPEVILGPKSTKQESGCDDVLLDTKSRRLYFFRDKIGS